MPSQPKQQTDTFATKKGYKAPTLRERSNEVTYDYVSTLYTIFIFKFEDIAPPPLPSCHKPHTKAKLISFIRKNLHSIIVAQIFIYLCTLTSKILSGTDP